MKKGEELQESRTTIKDVARMAHVSVSTVSRVFNGLDRVSSETRERVVAAMQALNYSPSTIATSMITGETKVILTMVPNFTNPFFSLVLSGVEEQLHENGYYSMVLSHMNLTAAGYEQIQQKFDKVVDGIIAIPDWNLQFYKEWGKPCVMVDRYIRGGGLNSVLADNFHGAYQLTEALIRAGHRRIALISGKAWMTTMLDRLDGFYSALRNNGIPQQDEYIIIDKFTVNSGCESFKKLMALPCPPTAVVATNNLICIGCIQACEDLRLRIGEDISLVGYDDHELARYMPPGITVVRQPAETMGKCAAGNLLAQLKDPSRPTESLTLDVEFIPRGSIRQI